MAVVYRAHDRHLDRPVAIKVLRPELSSGLQIDRFQREIGVTAKLVHPGIVALFDSGEADGQLYYVMPLVSGDTLRSRLAREGRLPATDVGTIGADLAEALAYAHGAGVVHRDIKPENVFLVENRAVLADFGIARATAQQSAQEGRTTAGTIVGTVTYMSPEQIEGADDLDGRSDLYSLGCMLYELLAGSPPFTGPSDFVVLAKHVTEMPAPLRERGVAPPPALEAILMRLLAKERADRFATAAELAPALRAAVPPVSDETTRAPSFSVPRATPSESGIDRLLEEAMAKLNLAVMPGPGSVRRMEESRVLLDSANRANPSHPRVLSGLGRWYNAAAHRLGIQDLEEVERLFAEGRRYLLLALSADDQEPEVHAVLAKVALYHDDDFQVAEHHARRSVALAPSDPEALRFLGIIEKMLDHLDVAIETLRRATRVAPKLGSMWNSLGDVLLAAGRNAEAADALQRAMSLQPSYVPALERFELAHLRLGEPEFAADVRGSRLRALGLDTRADALERNVRELDPARARQLDLEAELQELLNEASRTDPFANYFSNRTLGDRIVFAYTELGDWAAGLEWIERGHRSRPARLRRALTDQLYDRRGFATLPRYARLLRLAGLEELL